MNLRCTYCQTPFTLGMDEKLAALRRMHTENLHHYDAYCPRCRRANPISRERLEMFTPGWQEALNNAPAPVESAPVAAAPKAEPAAAPVKAEKPAAPARRKHATAAKKTVTKAAATAKPKAKPAAKKPAKAKPAAKKTTAKTKKK